MQDGVKSELTRLVAGCASSTYDVKMSIAETGTPVGRLLSPFDVIVNTASEARLKYLMTRCTLCTGFNGRIAR